LNIGEPVGPLPVGFRYINGAITGGFNGIAVPGSYTFKIKRPGGEVVEVTIKIIGKDFVVTGGRLPGGMSVGVGGNLYGIPVSSGNYSFNLSYGAEEKKFFIRIFGPPAPPPGAVKLADVQQGDDVSIDLNEHFQSCAGLYVVKGIPPGMSFAGGVISGFGSEAGSWDFSIQKGACQEKHFRLNVLPSAYLRFIDVYAATTSLARRMGWAGLSQKESKATLADGNYFDFPDISNRLRDGSLLISGFDASALAGGVIPARGSVYFQEESSINCSISCWIYLENEQYIGVANNGILDLRVENNIVALYAISPISEGKWQGKISCPIYSGWSHFVAVSNSTEAKLYVNGELKGVLI
jgi:hypothetical protein